MRYRECTCGAQVDEYSDSCPICEADVSREVWRNGGGESGTSSGPRMAGDAGSGRLTGATSVRDEWYYMAGGRMEGPCQLEFLVGSLRCGALALETQVWKPGMRAWVSAGSLPEISAAIEKLDEEEAAANPELTEEDPDELRPLAFGSRAAPLLEYGELPESAGGWGSGREVPLREPRSRELAGPSTPSSHGLPPNDADSEADAPIGLATAPRVATEPPFERTDERVADVDTPVVSTHPHPWRRWFARVVDTSIAGVVVGLALGILAPQVTVLDSNVVGSITVLALWMLAEPFVLSGLGTTPGKALLNVRLRQSDGVRILRLNQAFTRSFRVWFRGLACGLPIVTLFTMANAYVKLDREGVAPWDEKEGFQVSHGELDAGRVVGLVLFGCFYLLLLMVGAVA